MQEIGQQVSNCINKVVLSCCLLTLSGCQWGQWVPDARFEAPDRSARIEVRSPESKWFNGFEVLLVQEGRETSLYKTYDDALRKSMNYVYWSPDSRVVAVFRCGAPRAQLAFDRRALAPVSFDEIANEFRKTIATEYNLDLRQSPVTFIGHRMKDEFEWACSQPGIEAFYSKHPPLPGR